MLLALAMPIFAYAWLPQTQVVTAAWEAASLAAQIGQPIEIASVLSNKHVLVVSHGAPPDTVLRAFVTALDASLKRTSTGFAISRDADTRKAIELRRTRLRVEWLRRKVDLVSKYRARTLKSASAIDAIYAESTRQASTWNELLTGKRFLQEAISVNQLLPAEGLLEGLISRIGFERIAAVGSGKSAVYEDRPTADCLPLPPHEDLSLTYETGMSKFRSAKAPADVRRIPGMADFFIGWNASLSGVDRLRLHVRSEVNQIQVRLEAYNKVGNIVDAAHLLAGPTDTLNSPQTELSITLAEPAQNWLKLSDVGADAARFGFDGRYHPYPAWFLNPEKQEPLNLVAAQAILTAADAEPNRCFVADVSDALFQEALACCKDGKLNLGAFWSVVDQWSPYQRVVSKEAFVLRPEDTEAEEETNANRAALGRFARRVASDGFPDIRSVARLYYEASAAPAPLADHWCRITPYGSLLWQNPGSLSGKLYRMLGAISDSQWDRLEAGVPLTCGSLGILTELKDCLLNDVSLRAQGRQPFPDIARYPCELYPVGISADTPLSIQHVETPVMRVWDSDKKENEAFWTARDFTEGLRPLVRGGSNGSPPQVLTRRDDYEKFYNQFTFRSGTRSDTNVTIGLPAGLFITRQAYQTAKGERQTFRYRDLPQDLRDEKWQRACKEALESFSAHQNHAGAPQTSPRTIKPRERVH